MKKQIKSLIRDRGPLLFWFFVIVGLVLLLIDHIGQDRIIEWIDSLGIRGPVMIVFIRIFTIIFPVVT